MIRHGRRHLKGRDDLHRSLHIPLQPPQALLRLLEHVVILADGKTQIILRHMGIPVGVKLRRRDRRNAELHDEEPAELEVAGPTGDVGREGVVCGEVDVAHVYEDEVAAFGVGVLGTIRKLSAAVRGRRKGGVFTNRQAELVEHFVESVHFAFHLFLARFPESLFVCLFEAYGYSFLQRADAAVAYTGVSSRDVLDKVLGSDEPAHTPTGTVEVLASGTDGQSEFGYLRG